MKIMVATDGSDFSSAALDKAREAFGHIKDAEFMIVSAYEPMKPMASEPFAVSAEYYNELTEAARNQAAHYAEEAASGLSARLPGSSVGWEVLEGKPATRIVEYAEDWDADVIVVGSQGRGFWGRLLGSVSNAVLHHAPCSVLVVRKPAE